MSALPCQSGFSYLDFIGSILDIDGVGISGTTNSRLDPRNIYLELVVSVG